MFDGSVDFGWRGRPIVLAALGAAVLSRFAFHPDRTGGLAELEMQVLAYLALEAADEQTGQLGVNVESVDVALACDADELDERIQTLVDRRLLAYNVDDPDESRIAITDAGVAAVQDWLRRATPMFPRWPNTSPGVDDATD